MEIIIQNFKGITYKKINFENKFYLLKGNSGSGKSTICEAIRYVLYNTSRLIKPLNNKNKTVVILSYRDIVITRSKNPELLKLVKNSKEYLNNEAQNIIYQYFENEDIWTLSSYIAQNKRNIFLENSNSEKIEIIKRLIFKEDLRKTNRVISIIEKIILSLEDKIKKNQNLIDYLDNEIESFDEKNKDIKESYYKAIQVKDLDKTIESEKVKLKYYDSYLEFKNSYNSLEDLKAKIKEKYPKNLNIETIKNWQSFLANKTSIENFDFEKSVSDYDSLQEEFYKIKKNRKILEKFPNQNIQELKIKINQKINFLKNKIILNEVKKLKDYLGDLEVKSTALNKQWIEFLKVAHDELVPFRKELSEQLAKNYLSENIQNFTCPSCKKCLYLKKGNLVLSKLVLSNDEKTKYRKLIRNLETIENYKKSANDKISNLSEKLIQDSKDHNLEISDLELQNSLKILDGYTFTDRELKMVSKELEYHKMYDQYSNLKKYINYPYQAPEDFESYYKDYLKEIEIVKNFSNIDIKSLENFNPENLKLLEKYKRSIEIYKPILERIEKLKTIKNETIKFIVNLENTKRLETIYKETINNYLENNIQNINIRLNNILSNLFDDINIYISLFKEVKNKNKPIINFKIIMKGIEYPNFNYFSEGEKDRISIALTITFNIILGSKMLIFDEVFSSLEEKKREDCLKTIKSYSPDKILINVCHETIEGYYDSIINI